MKKNTDSIHHARNIFGINSIARKTSNSKLYYLYNGHADVVAMVDSNGNVINYYDYDIYGNIKEASESGIENPIRYAGQYYDDESDLYYLRARYYDPGLMRFISEDSYRGKIDDPLSLNLFTYAQNNPLAYIDPSGHWVESVWDALNVGLDVFDIGMDFYTGDYWSLLIDIPALVGDGVAIAVPLVPGGIGTLKTPLRVGKTIKTYDKIQDMIKIGTKLDGFAKAFLRREARDFMLKNSDNFAKVIANGTKLDVHHIIPLEWAHVMGKGFDPNILDNLAGVDPKIHKKINSMWSEFRSTWKGKIPEANDIMEFVKKVNEKYGADFVR